MVSSCVLLVLSILSGGSVVSSFLHLFCSVCDTPLRNLSICLFLVLLLFLWALLLPEWLGCLGGCWLSTAALSCWEAVRELEFVILLFTGFVVRFQQLDSIFWAIRITQSERDLHFMRSPVWMISSFIFCDFAIGRLSY